MRRHYRLSRRSEQSFVPVAAPAVAGATVAARVAAPVAATVRASETLLEPRLTVSVWPAAHYAVRVSVMEAVMGLFSKDIKSMEDLYIHTVQDLYYAENQIVKSLPKMIDKATDAELKRGFQTHLNETENQVKRLERVFEMHDKPARGLKCPAIDGILREAEEVMGEVEGDEIMNTAIVALAQAVEHYEITRYGALIAWATELGHRQDAKLLGESLKEEKATDAKLTAIAERKINPRADAASGSGGARKKMASRKKAAAKKTVRTGKKTARSTARGSAKKTARKTAKKKSSARRRA
jgi:ferritin-like metal-binding protein YciE